MTAATLPARPQEARRAMTRPSTPHARPASLRGQADRIADLRPRTPTGYALTRNRLLDLAAQARADAQQLAGVRLVMRRVRAEVAAEQHAQALTSLRLKKHPTGTDAITRDLAAQWGCPTLDAQPQRDRTLTAQDELHARYHARHAANCLAHALHAVHTGTRQWEALSARNSILQVSPPKGPPSEYVSGPARITVRVPPSPWGPAATLHLYRSDYDRTLTAWGYDRAARAHATAATLRAAGADTTAVTEAHTLMLDAATHPNLARSWHAYVTSARLGDIYAPHSAGGMQLAPRRNGDLREALERIMVLAEYRPCAD